MKESDRRRHAKWVEEELEKETEENGEAEKSIRNVLLRRGMEKMYFNWPLSMGGRRRWGG